jgi:hypothetical protein
MSSGLATAISTCNPEGMLQAIDGIQVGGIADGDLMPLSSFRIGNDVVALGDVPGNGLDDVISQAQVSQLNKLNSRMSRPGLGDIRGPQHFLGHQQVDQAFPGRIGFHEQSLPARSSTSPCPSMCQSDSRLAWPQTAFPVQGFTNGIQFRYYR